MSDIAICTQGLGKQYHIGGPRKHYDRLSERLVDLLDTPFRRAGRLLRGQATGATELDEVIWALKDITLEIKQGEVIGIIGNNGAGKSTLLKILARITDLTEGYAEIHGRVGSLLEVGTGFHPDLTGRENIYLNGAILGMRRTEIARKFDEIVAFAEIEKFIETPVKHYSSGMYMRLAFAVAAHLEPEILVVDEVLAVGDAEFQAKCLGKMGDVAKTGRTILFVSHNLLAIETLCSRAFWLRDGSIAQEGAPNQVVSSYLRHSLQTATERRWPDADQTPGPHQVQLQRVCVEPACGNRLGALTVHTPLRLTFEYWNFDATATLSVSIRLYNEHNILIFDIASPYNPEWQQHPSPMGLLRTTCTIPGDLLNDGTHRIALIIIRNQQPVIEETAALVFNIQDGSVAERGGWYGKWPGAIRPRLAWETNIPVSA
ncbi:MAG: polysaccharide ABC transporter ATP-binding protein [Caldilineaceae bacterium]